MARVTIEDCLQVIPDRFQLIELAAKRARSLADDGANLLVERKNNREAVIALREIAAGYTSFEEKNLFADLTDDKDDLIDER